ncbi:MAG: tRNA pseudouridine(55) synthase TruB [Proteobacteria bacterium]|nr:tRNA pseudouridine(55) synthase TruB [Pseudomonadota bacterium]
MLRDQNIWININKPAGISSAKVVTIVKKTTKAKKVGHGGTLDPFACGVLPVALNRATKTTEKLVSTRKKYFFRITFGEFRDTDDVEGKIVESSSARPTTEEIISVLPIFIGKILQSPSRFSAIKIAGKRAYELARKEVLFEIPSREVEIFSLNLTENNRDYADFKIECGKGTYVRSLARDICKKVGVCGYVSKLTRLSVGDLCYEKTISLDALKAATNYAPRFSDGSLLFPAGCLQVL